MTYGRKNAFGKPAPRRGWGETTVSVYAVILTFLLPLKFGSIVAIPEVPLLYPDFWFDWLIVSWSPAVFALCAGVLPLGTALLVPAPSMKRSKPFLVAAAWTALALCSLIGWIDASVADFPLSQVTHMGAVACYGLGVYQLVERHPALGKWLLTAVVFGSLMSAFQGLHQLLEGFQMTRQFVYEQELRTGIKHSPGFHTRLMESRVSGNFTLCNSFAAHLILVIPVCGWWFWRKASGFPLPSLGKTAHWVLIIFLAIFALVNGLTFTPPLVALIFGFLTWRYLEQYQSSTPARWVFLPPVLIFLLVMLATTNSRAALVAFGAALAVLTILLPLPLTFRLAGGGAILLGTVTGLFLVNTGRGLGSMLFRLDYFWAAARMFFNNPWVGTGWGDFFHEFTRLKLIVDKESPHTPHNLILAFASQTGVLGLFFSVAALVVPFILVYLKLRRLDLRTLLQSYQLYALLGWTAWAIHSLADVNLQVGGTLATGLTVVLVAIRGFDDEQDATARGKEAGVQRRIVWTALVMVPLALSIGGGWRLARLEVAQQRLRNLCDPRNRTPEELSRVDFGEVAHALAECERLSPTSPFHLAIAADFAARRGRLDIAEKWYREVVVRSPERSSFFRKLALIQYHLGNYAETRKNEEKARKLFPRHPRYQDEE